MSFNIYSAIQSCTAVLTGIKNSSQWSHQVHSLLTMAGWWSIMEGISTHAGQADPAAQAIWIANNQQAQAMIAIFIHADLQHYQRTVMSQSEMLLIPQWLRLSGQLYASSILLLVLPGSTMASHVPSSIRSATTLETLKTCLTRSIIWLIFSMKCPLLVLHCQTTSKP
jgi:hypothetical protein